MTFEGVSRPGVLYQMKGAGFWEIGRLGIGDEKIPLFDTAQHGAFYGGGWFGFKGLCARLLVRTGIPDISSKIEKMFA